MPPTPHGPDSAERAIALLSASNAGPIAHSSPPPPFALWRRTAARFSRVSLSAAALLAIACKPSPPQPPDPTGQVPPATLPTAPKKADCRGTQPDVYRTCGCSPRDAALLTRLDNTNFTEDIREEVEKCAEGKAGVNVVKQEVFKADFTACLKSKTRLNNQYRDAVVRLVDNAANDVRDAEIDSWSKNCAEKVYTNLVSCSRPPWPPKPESASRGVWVGTLAGVAAQPEGAKQVGGMRLTVGPNGAVQGAYNVCAEPMPLYVVTGRLVGDVDHEGAFKGSYDYQGSSSLPLQGRVAIVDQTGNQVSANLSAPTDIRMGWEQVDTFYVLASRSNYAALPRPPEPCQPARGLRHGGLVLPRPALYCRSICRLRAKRGRA